MSRSTPWGAAQHVTSHMRGVSTVITASHGGMMISEGVGKKLLSEAAQARALKHFGYFCYEEDCDYLIPMYDSKVIRDSITDVNSFFKNMSEAEREKYMISYITRWNADYLNDIEVDPDPENYAIFVDHAEADRRRGERDPDVIVAAWVSCYTGVTRVRTADDKFHFVSSQSYSILSNDKSSVMRLLSGCELIAEHLLNYSTRNISR